MTSLDEIKSKFLDMNIDVDSTVLEKCKLKISSYYKFNFSFQGFTICTKYNLDAEDFCDEWYAYTISNLSGAAPTVEYLEQFERKEYQSSKAKHRVISTPRAKPSTSTSVANSYPFDK